MTHHISLASGGACLAVHAGFWHELERYARGQHFKNRVGSYSGSSAGAVIGTLQALHVPASVIVDDIRQGGGLQGHFPRLRALAVYLGLRKSMYDGNVYLNRLQKLCNKTKTRRPPLPMTVALTDVNMKQRCLTFVKKEGLLNATVASASIPYLLNARHVAPIGMCVDGSLTRASFPTDIVIKHLRTQRSGSIVLINCMPWPTYRAHQHAINVKSMALTWDNVLKSHNLEPIIRMFSPPLQFQDGVFSVQVGRRNGQLVRSRNGALHVTFVAPTQAQFQQFGGMASVSNLSWKAGDSAIESMIQTGRFMARQFLNSGACR